MPNYLRVSFFNAVSVITLISISSSTLAGNAAYSSSTYARLACNECQYKRDGDPESSTDPATSGYCNTHHASIAGWFGSSGASEYRESGMTGLYYCNYDDSSSTSPRLFFYGDDGCNSQNETGRCNIPPNDPRGCPTPTSGNPIQTLSGIKVEIVVDYAHSKNAALSLYRTYSSAIGHDLFPGIIGHGKWLFSLSPEINQSGWALDLHRPDGRIIEVARDPGSGEGIYRSNDVYAQIGTGDILVRITQNSGSEIEEIYSLSNKIQSLKDLGTGKSLTYSYNTDLVTVTDELGNSVKYREDSEGRIVEFWGASSDAYFRYIYTNNILTGVIYPDNTTVQYHYENTKFPTALTGITNQKGDRYVTWEYDYEGRAISSEHAGGVDKYTLDYTHVNDPTDPRVTETNPLGKQASYHYHWQDGKRLLTKVLGEATASCVASNSTYTYDENGYVDLITDQEGNVTDYDYDSAGRLLSKTEAVGSPEERQSQTEWVTYTIDGAKTNLPARIIEADRVTEFVYSANGTLIQKNISPIDAPAQQ